MFLPMLTVRRPHLRMVAARRLDARRLVLRAAVVCALSTAALTSCANLSFERDTATSGTFESTATAFTLFSFDLPKGAMLIARENVSDANLANMVVTETRVTPYLGPFDWLLDIIGVRWARVRGTWGSAGENIGG
jgi:hypothetical protein